MTGTAGHLHLPQRALFNRLQGKLRREEGEPDTAASFRASCFNRSTPNLILEAILPKAFAREGISQPPRTP